MVSTTDWSQKQPETIMKQHNQSLILFKKLATPAGGFRKARRTLALAISLSLLAVMASPQANALGIPNPIANFTVLEDSSSSEFDLATVFSDATGYVLLANSNPMLVDASVSGSILVLDYQENQSGFADIRITATDGVNTVANSFTVTVIPVNDAPSTTPAVFPDQTTPVNTPVVISFTVNDVEDDALSTPTPLVVSVVANANPVINASGLALARSGANNSTCTLTMTPLLDATGEATISVTVGDNGFPPLSLTKTFMVTVVPSANNPPVAVINVSPDADLDGGDPEIILISVNGMDAPLTLDGTMSADPDGDPLTSHAWYVDSGDGPVPVGEGATVGTRLGIGDHAIFLSVSDGSLASPFAVKSVKVMPVSEAIGYLIDEVRTSEIRNVSRIRLDVALRLSKGFFSRGWCEAGVEQLRRFKALASEGRLSPPDALANEWTALADQIINNVTCE